MASPARFIVGIDLGTTHLVVAYAERRQALSAPPGDIRVFGTRQWVARGETAVRPLLPVQLYAPLPGEVDQDPWGDTPWVVGELAVRRGQEALGRSVASAKSWLCHSGVDRTAPILPWGLDETSEVPRLSPVEAATRALRHVSAAWVEQFPDHPLAAQQIVLTVPASFDEVARELTLLAARQADLEVRLLEEPQAAFYDYLHQRGSQALRPWVAAESDPRLILVCDVGGGTTDLTLIQASMEAGESLRLDRVAVGRHLLLGGDNMDLALAHACEGRLVAPPARLDARRFGQLVMACRTAKEKLLGSEPFDQVPITVLGSGSDLFTAAATTRLERHEVEQQVLEGFFPMVSRGARPVRSRSALVGFGLPYETDPAITRHVATFLARHAPEASGPHALLLNGGVFRAPRIVQRVRSVLESWTDRPLVLLGDTDPELAVARGAVAYGLALAGAGTTIGGGTAHGYYVGIDTDTGARLGLCVVPRGAKEGERHLVTSRPLSLTVGRPVRFELYVSDRAQHLGGDLVSIDPDTYDRLPPVAVTLGAAEGQRAETLPVVLEGELSAVGTLELACVEADPESSIPRRFRLAFDLRATSADPAETRADVGNSSDRPASGNTSAVSAEARPSAGAAPKVAGSSTRPPARLAEARAAIERVFGKSRKDVAAREVKDLLRTLEKVLGERSTWNTEVTRALCDELLQQPAARRRSPDHERVFWMLTGYCLRPGFGHPRDAERIQELVPLFEPGLAFPQENRGWQQFFIAWRRVAGGLGEPAQQKIFDTLWPFLAPPETAPRKPKGFKPLAQDEGLELASWLERLPSERRTELGRSLVERTWTRRDPRLWGAIGRIGARIPAYASVHHVVPPSIVERWLDHLLREKWPEVPTAPRAALDLARVTGDRARDVSEPVRIEVAHRMVQAGAPEEWSNAVREFVTVREADRVERFGEDLPVGLRLIELT